MTMYLMFSLLFFYYIYLFTISMCSGLRTAHRNWFSHYSSVVPVTALRPSGLAASPFLLAIPHPSHLIPFNALKSY